MDRAAELEAGAAVQADGGEVRGVADDGDHQAEALSRAGVDQRPEQCPADAFTLRIGADVDGILHREAVGRPRAISVGISITDKAAIELGDEVGIAGVGDGLESAQHLLLARRLQLEAGGAGDDRWTIDGSDGGNVGGGGWA
jgi:hypothetical protein